MRITIQDYPDQLSPDEDVARLKKDVAIALKVAPEEVDLKAVSTGVVATAKGKGPVEIAFVDPHDEVRLRARLVGGSALPSVNLGLDKSQNEVLLAPLPKADDEAIRAIKSALVKRLGVAVVDIRFKEEDHQLVAWAGNKRVVMRFAGPDDQARAQSLAQANKSDQLVDFGRQESDTVLQAGPFASLSDGAMVTRFKEQLAEQLGLKPEEVRFELKDGQMRLLVVRDNQWSLMAGRILSPVAKDQGIDVTFAKREDYVRLLKVVAKSKSPVVTHLGKPPSPFAVTIPAYPKDLKREEAIARFVDDLSRTLAASPEQIEVSYEGGVLEARVKGRNKVYDVLFKHAEDFERISRWAVESPSPRLADFGKKKMEHFGQGSVFLGYPDPAGKVRFTQSLVTQFYTGDSAQHHWKLGADMHQTPFGGQPFVLDSALVGYHHAFWGGLDMRLSPSGKFSLSNVESNFATAKWEKYWGRLSSFDGKAIAEAAGVIGGTALGLYAFSRMWPNQENLDIPLSLKVYDDGFLSVGAMTTADLTIGDKQLDLDFKSAGLSVRENIDSGVAASQILGYSAPDKVLTYGVAAQYYRFSGSFQQGADLDDGKLTGTQIVVSQGVPFSSQWVGNVGVKQEFDGLWKPINPALNLGVHYQLNETWGFSASTGVSAKDYQAPPDYGLTLGANLYL